MNWKELQKTDIDWFSPVQSSLFKVFDFEEPVSVPVLPKKGKDQTRPDQTRLSNTTHMSLSDMPNNCYVLAIESVLEKVYKGSEQGHSAITSSPSGETWPSTGTVRSGGWEKTTLIVLEGKSTVKQ